MTNNDATEGFLWATPRRTLQILVISVLVSFATKLNIGYPEWNWANYLGYGVADGVVIGGAAALVVLALLLFTKFRLPPERSKWLGFVAAMAIPSICIAPLQIWRSYASLEERNEDVSAYNQISDKRQPVQFDGTAEEHPIDKRQPVQIDRTADEHPIPKRNLTAVSPIDADFDQLRELAQSGNSFAQALLGYALAHGTHNKKAIKIELEEAVKWIKKSAEAKHPLGLCLMGLLREGVPMGASRWVVQDKEVALADFEEAMKNGLQRGAENGGAVWCTVWGKSLWRRHGLPIDPRDNAESFEWLKKAVELGDAMAEGAIGFKYFFGSGVPRDVKEMVKWCKMAAEHGDAEAALRLGMYYEAAPVDDWNEASRWYRQAAEQGYDYSACILYKHYQTGSGKDLEEAIKWCRQAVASGWASEADLKSLADFKSLKDERERELQKDKHAAEQGDADAQFRLSSRYSIVEKDDAQAVKWLLKASEQGHARAQSRLGWRYSDGEGVPKDLVRAYMWFDLGAASGNDKAKQEFERISKLMTKEEIADAQQKVREWKRESNDARH